MTGDHAQWWPETIDDVFCRLGDTDPADAHCHLAAIEYVMRHDCSWLDGPGGRRSYDMAQRWARSGTWDQLLVLITLAGRTSDWPVSSARWGAEPFNRWGIPNTGLLNIATLAQASTYRQEGVDSDNPFPIRQALRQARNWRRVMSDRPALAAVGG